MENVIHETATFLPNPKGLKVGDGEYIKREQCVEECMGCNKMFSDENIGDVCIAFLYPKEKHRLGQCLLQSNRKIEVIAKKKINPIKASKRARARRKK